MTQRFAYLLTLAVSFSALTGCGGGISAPTTHPVTGAVTVKGKAVAGVKVTFHPQFDMGSIKFTPSGLTGKDGRFHLSTAAAGDGAPTGEYAVTFELIQVSADKSGREIEVDAWKGRYADPAAARKVTVQNGDNNLEPFKLD